MVSLDTNVISEIRKSKSGTANSGTAKSGKADNAVAAWFRATSPASPFLPVIAIHALELGMRLAERRDPTQGALSRRWLELSVLPAFAGRVLPVDFAATAQLLGMRLVTRNVVDFVASGAEIINPWQLAMASPA